MTPDQAYKIVSDDSEAFASGILDLDDRKDYVSDLFRPGNSAELYLAQQTLLMEFIRMQKELAILKGVNTDGKGKDYPRAS